MKSGTTFIQARAQANRDLLADRGILFPGPRWNRQVRAVSDFIGGVHAGAGDWDSLRQEIAAHPGVALISMEYLGPLRPVLIARLVEELGDTDLHVVVTLRDLGRAVPAMWQETLTNRRTWTWTEYRHSIEHGGDAGHRFWRQQAAGRIVGRWASGVGSDHVTVVVVPPAGAPAELLWDRFCEAAGIAPADWAPARSVNRSLGAPSALLMRRLNQETADLELHEYKSRVKALAKNVLVTRRLEEEPIGFTVPDWLREISMGMTRRIADSGVQVIGDLAELGPVDVPGVDPDTLGPDRELAVAVAALNLLLRQKRPKTPRAGTTGQPSL
jgi:hypothetical protein